MIPKKERFITAKYEQTAYAIRPSKDEQLTLEDLNRQLWSCVRTSHVETTLRYSTSIQKWSEKLNRCTLHV